MALNRPYSSVSELPVRIPVFPLSRAIVFPRAQLPLNIFEPRYLALFDEAMRGERIVGMVQPLVQETLQPSDRPQLHTIGCAARISQFAESGDGRYLITLTGVCRFRIVEEAQSGQPYRIAVVNYENFVSDLEPCAREAGVDRDRVTGAIRSYADARGLRLDWDEVKRAPTEALINAISMMGPFGPAEKQALLEASSLRDRSETLIAITEIEVAQASGPTVLQ